MTAAYALCPCGAQILVEDWRPRERTRCPGCRAVREMATELQELRARYVVDVPASGFEAFHTTARRLGCVVKGRGFVRVEREEP